jgi:hypothetical protein
MYSASSNDAGTKMTEIPHTAIVFKYDSGVDDREIAHYRIVPYNAILPKIRAFTKRGACSDRGMDDVYEWVLFCRDAFTHGSISDGYKTVEVVKAKPP